MKKTKLFLVIFGLLTIGQFAFGQAGSTFNNSDTVNSLPFIVPGETTCGFGNNHSTTDIACIGNFMSGDEKIYSFTPTSNMNNIEVSISNISDNFSGLFITDDSVSSGNCIGSVTDPTSNDRVISGLSLSANTTYYIIVSSWANPQCIASYDIKILDQTCPAPDSLGVANLTATAVDLIWAEMGSATQWTVEYGPSGFTQGSAAGTVVPGATNPWSISSLNPTTSYDYYVQADCGSSTSYWVGPFSFTTPCLPVLAPITESFDITALPTCWYQTAVGGGPWFIGGNPGWGASGTPDHTGNNGNYIWLDFSAPVDTAVSFITADFDVSGLTVPALEFYFFTNNANDATLNELHIEAYDGSNWTLVDTIILNAGSWTKFTYDLSSFTFGNNLVRLRFRGEEGAGTPFYQDILIDDISIMEMPSCPSPTYLAANPVGMSADLSWTENGSATQWEVEYGAPGFLQGSAGGTLVPAPSNPLTISGLTVTSNYEYYVRSICGPGDTSVWVGPFDFRTTAQCPAPIALNAVVSGNTAQLNWDEYGSATTWQYQYGTAGFVLGTGTGAVITADSVSISSLLYSTNYSFYVRAICGPGDTSAWAGATGFLTPCAVNTPYYAEIFNTFTPICWEQAGDGNQQTGPTQIGFSNWGTRTTMGGPTVSINLWLASKNEWALSPYFDLSAGGYELSIDVAVAAYFSTNPILMGSDDSVKIMYTEDDTTWNSIVTYTRIDSLASSLTNFVYPLTSTGTNVRFAIWGSEGTVDDPEDLDFHFDNFIIRTPPTCPLPSALMASNATISSIDLGWTENGGATQWLVEYGAPGFAPGTGTDSLTNNNPLSLNGLASGSNFDFYVTAICAVGDSSVTVGPSSFSISPDYCSGNHFYDNGGATGNYANNSNDTTVICASTPGDIVEVVFNSFNLENGWDDLYVYDGDNTSSALIGVFSGTTIPGPFLAGSTSGCLTFVFTSDGSVNRPGWDATVNCTPPPTCPAPQDLAASPVSLTSFSLSWTEIGTASQWEIEYGISGFVPTGSGSLVSNNPTLVTGVASTDYEFYVRSVCGAADSSVWVGPFGYRVDFNPPGAITCTTGNVGVLFSDEMDVNNGWTGDISTANGDWEFPVGNPGGNSSGTGPSGPASGTTFAEFEASALTTTGAVATMVSPMIDLSSVLGVAELSFYMHAFGDDMGTLDVKVGTSATGPFTTVFTHTGQYQTAATDPWAHIGVDISTYVGQQVYIAFTNTHSPVSWEGDRAIDLVEVKGCISCPSPDSLDLAIVSPTALDFGWHETGSATSWEIEYDDSLGFVLGSGTGTRMTASGNPESFIGLNANSDYQFYVRAICGPGDTSAWSGPVSITTPCAIITNYPFLENFDLTSPTLPCWVNEYEVAQANWGVAYGALGGAITASQTGNYNLVYVSQFGNNSPITNAVSPTFDLTSLVAPRMSFYYAQEEWFGDQNYTRVLYRISSTDPWVEIWGDSSNVDVWTKVTINLPSPSATYQIAFQGINNNGRRNVVDEFVVEDTPANDLTVMAVNLVGDACGLGLDSIQAVIVNNGSADQSGFSMGYSINGFSITPEVVSSTIAAFDTMIYTFSTLGNFATAGSYDVAAYSLLSGDVNVANDTAMNSVNKTYLINSYPYLETFAPGQEGWYIENGIGNAWEFGTPNKTVINSAASDSNCFVTRLIGPVGINEFAVVNSPCFDFSNLVEPHVQMSVWWDINQNWDGANLQYTTDEGDTWATLGEVGSGENWYTSGGNIGVNEPIWTGFGTNGSEGWKSATIKADSLAGMPSVKFRVLFMSDRFVNNRDGFAFDDFAVFDGMSLGQDTVLCTNDTMTLDPGLQLGYLWSDSSLSRYNYLDAAVLSEGVDTIDLIVSGPGGFKMYDTVVIVVEKPVVSIGSDTILCFGESITLTADAGFNAYVWNDNSTLQTIQTDGSKTGPTDYYVVVTTVNNCPATDSVNVNVNTEVLVDLGSDTTFWDEATQGSDLLLDAGPGFSSYLWMDGSTGQTLLADSLTGLEIWVVVTNASGCEGTDTILVDFNLSIDGGLTVSQISMYPNPTSDFINISVTNFAALGEIDVKVLDITGKVVITDKLEGNGNTFSKRYDISSLATGTYFVQFEANGEVATRQFIIK